MYSARCCASARSSELWELVAAEGKGKGNKEYSRPEIEQLKKYSGAYTKQKEQIKI